MSNLTDERLQDLVWLVNNRLREFGPDTFPLLSWGVVRLMLGAVREWDGTQDTQVVHGPTGAAIAREGIMRLDGDGYGSFDHDGERIKFRITLSDDEANADRYYRGFNDGVEFVESGERDRVAEQARSIATCRVCGCTDDRACEGGCYWVEDDLCSACASRVEVPVETVSEMPDYLPGDPTDAEISAELAAHEEAVEALVGKESLDRFDAEIEAAVRREPSVNAQIGRDSNNTPLLPRSPIGPGRVPDPDQARENVAMMLATGSGGALAQAIAKPRTLEEVDADRKRDYKREYDLRAKRKSPSKHDRAQGSPGHARAGRNGNGLPTLEMVLAEIKRQAMAGVAPSMSQFNDARPANWATANAQMKRFDMTWHQLIERAGLKPNRRME